MKSLVKKVELQITNSILATYFKEISVKAWERDNVVTIDVTLLSNGTKVPGNVALCVLNKLPIGQVWGIFSETTTRGVLIAKIQYNGNFMFNQTFEITEGTYVVGHFTYLRR